MPVSPVSNSTTGPLGPPKLSMGDKGPDVLALQKRLASAGFSPGTPDGEFGPGTKAAVVAFQKSKGLVADGVAGSATQAALGQPSAPAAPARTNTPAASTPSAPATSTPAAPAAPAAPAVTHGWPAEFNTSKFLNTAATGASGAVANTGVSPTQVLKTIKGADVSVDVPLRAGKLGSMEVAPGTHARMALSVSDGNIDFAKSRMVFNPPLSGPLGSKISDVQMRADGRAEVELPGLPNAIIGNPAPANLGAFVESIQNSSSIPVRVLGMKVGDLRDGSSSGGSAPAADLSATRLSAKNVSFQDGALPLGNAGRVRFTPDSKLELSGTLKDLTLTGHVGVKDMDLSGGGTRISGAEGGADLTAHWTAAGGIGPNGLPAGGTLSARLDNLNISAQSAVSKRPNGDFIELGQGKVQGGSVSITQNIQNGHAAGPADAQFSLSKFDGSVTRAQLTIPDGNGTAQVLLKDSRLSGSIAADPNRVHFAGDIALDATLKDWDGKPGAAGRSAHVDSAAIQGSGHVDFDSTDGLKLAGRAKVDVNATGVDVGQKALTFSDASAHVTGSADVKLDENGLAFGNGDLRLSASANDGKIQLGSAVSLDLKAGTHVDAALKQVVFGPRKLALDLANAHVDAKLDGGRVTLPGGSKVDLKDGAELAFTLDSLSVPAQGTPSATGQMTLTAGLDEQQVSRADLARIPGLNLTSVQGMKQQLRLSLGRFSIAQDGSYEVRNLSAGIEATIDRITGNIR